MVKAKADTYKAKRVVVMGLGRFGGGIGVSRFLAGAGARVLVTDMADESTLRGSLDALAGLDIDYRLGRHDEGDLKGADLLVVSPAVDRRRSTFFQAALARGVPWTTEINIFIEQCPARMLSVTGSIGKSTTCAMLHGILSDQAAREATGLGPSFLGGNIGESLLDRLADMTPEDTVVLEISSFQLECTPLVPFAPAVAGLTNARPHHLDRHGSFDDYVKAKLNVFRGQQAGAVAVLGTDDQRLLAAVRAIADRCGSRVVVAAYNGERYDLRVPGMHNQANAHMAAAMATGLGVPHEITKQALATFAGLPDRLELVSEARGVRYYNDSKATSAEAVATALAAMDAPVVLICGGKDIGDELNRIIDAPWSRVRCVICFGDAGNRLAELIGRTAPLPPDCTARAAGRMGEAVEIAMNLAAPGDVVLLSPGCPSYDEFVNYRQRGEAFKQIVHAAP